MYKTNPVEKFPSELTEMFDSPVFIASGSTSMVFKAYFKDDKVYADRPMAVKIPIKLDDGYSLKDFYNEVAAVSSGQHPNIAGYHRYFLKPRTCIVMDYAKGRPLSVIGYNMADDDLKGVIKDMSRVWISLHARGYVLGSVSLDDILVRKVAKRSSDAEGNLISRRAYRSTLVDLGGLKDLRSDAISSLEREKLRAADLVRFASLCGRIRKLGKRF